MLYIRWGENGRLVRGGCAFQRALSVRRSASAPWGAGTLCRTVRAWAAGLACRAQATTGIRELDSASSIRNAATRRGRETGPPAGARSVVPVQVHDCGARTGVRDARTFFGMGQQGEP